MFTFERQKELNPFASDFARKLYEKIVKSEKKQIDFAEKVNRYTEKAQEAAAPEEGEGWKEAPADDVPQEQPMEGPRREGQAIESPRREEPRREAPNVLHFPGRSKDPADYNITLSDVVDWYQHKETGEVIAQNRAMLRMTLMAVSLKSFALEGPAGSGKTYMLNSLMSVIPEEKFYWHEQATDTALFNDADKINRAQILMIPEYQKILDNCPQTRETIKTITEGRIAKRKKMVDGEIKEFTIYPKCVMTSIADENESKERLSEDKEDMRRFSHIRVDSSPETTRKIREYVCEKLSMRPELLKHAPDSLGDKIKAHMANCMELKLKSPALDPFVYYVDQFLPETDKSRAYVHDYYGHVQSCAKFHHRQRELQHGRETFHVADIADHYVVYNLYHKEFCNTLKALDNLVDFGERGKRYNEPLNWRACFEAGIAKMKENFPEVVVNKWIGRQLTNNKVFAFDVEKQEDVALFDYEP